MRKLPSNPAAELLALKSKAYRGVPWTDFEQETIRKWLLEGGAPSILAACCILASRSKLEWRKSLHIVSDAMKKGEVGAYTELSIYEALTQLEIKQLQRLSNDILFYLEASLRKRPKNLDNAVCVVGRLARVGDSKALQKLRSLANHTEPEISENAREVLDTLAPGHRQPS
jgi:hypothetical protein